MPGRLSVETPLAIRAGALGATLLCDDPGLRRDAAPGETLPVLTAAREIRAMRWGMVMTGRRNARGRPVMETIVNARSETVFAKSAYDGVARCVVPVDAWYEWTGPVRRKTRWRIAPADGAPMLFAAICDRWQGPGGVELWQVATLTCAPNADVRDVHHRMPVILPPEALAPWLDGDPGTAAALLRPAPDGSLAVGRSDLA